MKNKEYWHKRFIELENQNTKKTAKYYENLERQFKNANKKIEAELLTWYRRFAINNNISLAEAKRILNAKELKELHWDVNEYIKYGKENAINQQWLKELENASARKHITRLEALQLQLQQQIEVLYDNQLDGFDKLARDLYKTNYFRTAFEIQKGFNIGYDLHSYNENQLEKALNQVWGADGGNFSSRIWKHKKELINSLNNEITLNIIKGKSPDDAINNIARKFNTSKFNAGRLVMTESSFISSLSQKDCYKDLDVEKYEIVATLDSHTSTICQDMDGEVFKLSDYESGTTAPPFHPYCRSCTCPYFPDNYGERIARDKNGDVYYVPSDMKYKDWYKKFVEGERKTDLQLLNKDDIIKKASNILNWKQYAKEIKDEYDIEIDNSVFDLNLDTVKSSFAGVEKMINDFPEIKEHLTHIKVNNKGEMSYAGGVLNFNKSKYKLNQVDLLKSWEDSIKTGYWVKNSNLESVGIHEGTHMLERVLIYLSGKYSTKTDKVLAWNKSLESKSIVNQAIKNIKKTAYGKGKFNKQLRKSISIYANDNYSETLAESFADVYVNGNNANPLSIEIKRLTLETYNKYKGV